MLDQTSGLICSGNKNKPQKFIKLIENGALVEKISLFKLTLSLENIACGCAKPFFFFFLLDLEERGIGKRTGDIYT